MPLNPLRVKNSETYDSRFLKDEETRLANRQKFDVQYKSALAREREKVDRLSLKEGLKTRKKTPVTYDSGAISRAMRLVSGG